MLLAQLLPLVPPPGVNSKGACYCQLCGARYKPSRRAETRPFQAGRVHTGCLADVLLHGTQAACLIKREDLQRSRRAAAAAALPPLSRPSSPVDMELDSAPPAPLVAALPAPPLTRLPTNAPSADHSTFFAEYGYALVRQWEGAADIARFFEQLQRPAAGAACVSTIAGDVQQVDLDKLLRTLKKNSERRLQLEAALVSWQAIARAVAAHVAAPQAAKHFVAPKLLVAAPGDGQQVPHWDNPDGYSLQAVRLSVILYCTHSNSTAMPTFPETTFPRDTYPHAASFAPEEEQNRLLLQQHGARLQPAEPFLQPSHFHHVSVQPGDIMIFSQRTPHFGVANVAAQPRIVLFSMLSDTQAESGVDQDGYQVTCARAAARSPMRSRSHSALPVACRCAAAVPLDLRRACARLSLAPVRSLARRPSPPRPPRPPARRRAGLGHRDSHHARASGRVRPAGWADEAGVVDAAGISTRSRAARRAS